MMERLARLADRRARRVLIFTAIVFVVAGALGTGVAERLDPFGADDPKSESVIADQRLEQAGFRETGVVVLVEGADARSPQGRGRIETITGELTADSEVASVSSEFLPLAPVPLFISALSVRPFVFSTSFRPTMGGNFGARSAAC